MVFDRPAVAFLVDITFADLAGNTSTITSKYDNFAKEGQEAFSKPFAPAPESLASVTGVVRYVLYDDGSIEANVDAATTILEFEPLRAAVRDVAERYAELARQ